MGREQSEPVPDDEDWMAFSTSDYGGGGYDPWSEMAPLDTPAAEGGTDGDGDDDLPEAYDVSPAPSAGGLAHLVRIACCDNCLGRVGGRTVLGSTPLLVGEQIRAGVISTNPELGDSRDDAVCPLCEDLLDDVGIMSKRLVSGLEGYEIGRLQIGIQLPPDLIESEEHIRKRYGAPGSTAIKPALSRALGDEIRLALAGVELVSERPDVLVLVDGLTLGVKLDHRSLFLYTRYRKLERGIPQTRWPCRTCKGRGCERCDDTGLQYPDSVQALISDPLLELFGAQEHSTHSMGREDIDVRCLGRGRPTVIELKQPRRRTTDLEAATELVNAACEGRVEIEPLRRSDKSEVIRLKNTPAEKSYRINFSISIDESEQQEEEEGDRDEQAESQPRATELPDEDQIRKILQSLQGTELAQRTPKRVSHRRADKVRKRRIISVQDIEIDGATIELTLRAQSGTYIKELIGSDDGRTKPSVSELLAVNCDVQWLDVLEIHAD